MFPGFCRDAISQEGIRIDGISGKASGKDFHLSAIQEPLSNSAVSACMGPGAFPVSCHDQGSRSVSEQDGPQPLVELMTLLVRGSQVCEAHGVAVHFRTATGPGCLNEAVKQAVSTAGVPVSDEESGNVDHRFEGVPGLLCAQGMSAQVDLGVAPAQFAGQEGHTAVTGDQGGLVLRSCCQAQLPVTLG